MPPALALLLALLPVVALVLPLAWMAVSHASADDEDDVEVAVTGFVLTRS